MSILEHEVTLTGSRGKARCRGLFDSGAAYSIVRRDIAEQIAEKDGRSLSLLKHALGVKKKKLLVDARLQEDLMHRITFSFPETRRTINELYPE